MPPGIGFGRLKPNREVGWTGPPSLSERSKLRFRTFALATGSSFLSESEPGRLVILGAAAKKDGLQVPTELSAEQSAEVRSFSRLSGKEFDSKYAQVMVKDHTDDLAAFQKAESSAEKPDLKQAIAAAIPVIEHHLEMAKQL